MIRAARHGGFDFRDARILVVDDEDLSRALAYNVISKFGCAVVDAAETAREALDAMFTATRPYHVVVSDFNMPGMNGLQLLKAVRSGSPGIARDVGFAMLTGHSDKELVGAAFNLDVDCFIVKPVSAERMRSRISRILSTDRPIRPPIDYIQVEVDVTPDATGPAPAPDRVSPGVVVPGGADRLGRGGGTPLSQVMPGAVLSGDVFTSNGQKLLTKGFTLDKRMIERLSELAELDSKVATIPVEG